LSIIKNKNDVLKDKSKLKLLSDIIRCKNEIEKLESQFFIENNVKIDNIDYENAINNLEFIEKQINNNYEG